MPVFWRGEPRPPAQVSGSERDVTLVARPTVSLLELVRERRFSARNKRHRRKLLEDDSLIAYCEWSEDAPPLWRSLVEIQLHYRHDYGLMDRSYTSQGARSFESHLRLRFIVATAAAIGRSTCGDVWGTSGAQTRAGHKPGTARKPAWLLRVERTGIEPVTSGLQSRRSPS